MWFNENTSTFGRGKRKFNRFAGAAIGFIVIVFAVIVVGNTQLRKEGYIEVRVPDMRGSYDSYWCKGYREENGCLVFNDAMGRERKICGTYQIIK